MKVRRRKYVVDYGFQWGFVLVYVLASLSGSIVVLTLFNILAVQKLTEMIYRVHTTVDSPSKILIPLFLWADCFAFLFLLLVLIVVGVVMMRKVRGPLFRMMNGVSLMSQGDFSLSITLHRTDSFIDVAEALEQMRQRIRERFLGFGKEYQAISKSLAVFSTMETENIPDEKRNILLVMIRDLKQRL
ncbi:MAG: hypothetical protein C0403_04765 [Desulfobacterium sp.]|nr:hypothetical protein [Desulfobacterium sp.]